jgi:hypothetical protein
MLGKNALAVYGQNWSVCDHVQPLVIPVAANGLQQLFIGMPIVF